MVSHSPRRQEAALPTCYIHFGTHKTGTTSLQTCLAANVRALADAGILFPQTGRPRDGGGHHNLAWELAGDPRFNATRGGLDDAVREVAADSRRPTVCISSEDFEYLHADRAALTRLRDAFTAIGYRVVAVLYLRPQASYAESLYAELVKHGYARRFDDYLATIVRDGVVVTADGWRFCFDYLTLLDDVAAVFGHAQTIARPYPAATRSDALLTDFLAILDGGRSSLDPRDFECGARLNVGSRFIDVVRRYRENVHARGGGESVPRDSYVPPYNSRFDPIALPDIAQIAARFAASNAAVFDRYGVAVPFVSRRDLLADILAALGFAPGSTARRRLLQAEPGAKSVAALRPQKAPALS